jgi:hypothetical protein
LDDARFARVLRGALQISKRDAAAVLAGKHGASQLAHQMCRAEQPRHINIRLAIPLLGVAHCSLQRLRGAVAQVERADVATRRIVHERHL